MVSHIAIEKYPIYAKNSYLSKMRLKTLFFQNISVCNYFRKNNEDTFFLENLILFKNDVLIIFSKISGFCSINHFFKEKWSIKQKILIFEKTSLSLNIVDFIQFFALNSNSKSEFQSEIRIFCNCHYNFIVRDKTLIKNIFINVYIFFCSKISFEQKSILINFCINAQLRKYFMPFFVFEKCLSFF